MKRRIKPDPIIAYGNKPAVMDEHWRGEIRLRPSRAPIPAAKRKRRRRTVQASRRRNR